MRAPFGLKEICHPILYNKNKIPQNQMKKKKLVDQQGKMAMKVFRVRFRYWSRPASSL
jgi:hypothetical protein